MKNIKQLGLALTTIILIISCVLAMSTLTYIFIQRINNSNQSVSLSNIANQFREDWRGVLKVSAFEADPLEQYLYNLKIEKKTNSNANIKNNINTNISNNNSNTNEEININSNNKNVNNNINYNSNANINSNNNLNQNINNNTNLNQNLNTNTNQNINANINYNVNVNSNNNINLNQNLNINTNQNTNLNQNVNFNNNVNINLNSNFNQNINKNNNINSNLNNNINKNLNNNINTNLNENTNKSETPERPNSITKKEWYKNVKNGTLVFQVNWYCSAAGMKIYFDQSINQNRDIGLYHGDCTNPSVQVKGNFKPVKLEEYKKGKQISFRLESDLYSTNKTVHTNIEDKCHIDYFPFSGRKDVPAIQFTCDDGYNMGLWDDIQFTVYVFPKGKKIDIPEVITQKDIDTDGDGITDLEEIKIGTKRSHFDTDNDGYSDKTEIDKGYSPLIPATKPNPNPETYEKKYYDEIPETEIKRDDMDLKYPKKATPTTLYTIEDL